MQQEGKDGKNMTERKRLIEYLGADTEDLENPAFFRFYQWCLDAGMDVHDADRYAILNTLFGYDIGKDIAMEINDELWNMDIDTFELSSGCPENRKLVEEVVEKFGIDVDFSNWQEDEYKAYSFFSPDAPAKVRR